MSCLTILVEDNPTIRETLIPALSEMADAQVVSTATSAAEAKTVLEQWDGHWRLLVVDLFLSAGSGLDVLVAVTGRGAHQFVYVLSNYATRDIRRQCLTLGADGVFDKSTELDAFFETCINLPATRFPAMHP